MRGGEVTLPGCEEKPFTAGLTAEPPPSWWSCPTLPSVDSTILLESRLPFIATFLSLSGSSSYEDKQVKLKAKMDDYINPRITRELSPVAVG